METLANSMGVALENARLFDETTRLLKETEQQTAELGVINSVQEGLAPELGVRDPVHGLPARRQARDLHNKSDRGAQPAAAQSDQDQRPFPQRGGRPKTDLPSHHQRHPEMDQGRRLDESPPGVQDPVRRPTARLTPTQLDGHPRTIALSLAPA